MVGLRLGPLECCLVNHPDLITRVLGDMDDFVIKPWDERQLAVALGEGLLTGSGTGWRRQRRWVEPAFRGERIRGYAEVMGRRAMGAAGEFDDGVPVDVHAAMQAIMLGIVGETLFGTGLEARARVVADGLGAVTNRFENLLTGWVPIPFSVPTPGNLRMRRAIRRLHAMVDAVVRERRGAPGDGDDLLGALLEAGLERDGGPGDTELREIVLTLLAAGHETTALAVAWTLHLLGLHPDIDAALAEEAREALGDRPPDAATVERLPFARQVIRESLRLYPPAWGIGREATREVSLGGYRIPAGTQIYLIQWVTHRDPRWYDDPHRFRPERWSTGPPPIPAGAWFPFGAGPRSCLGAGFALVEAPLVLATLVRRWRFQPVAGHPVELQPAITLRPRHGIRMVPRRR